MLRKVLNLGSRFFDVGGHHLAQRPGQVVNLGVVCFVQEQETQSLDLICVEQRPGPLIRTTVVDSRSHYNRASLVDRLAELSRSLGRASRYVLKECGRSGSTPE